MALTGGRWLALAGLGCLALGVVYWPVPSEERDVSPQAASFFAHRHNGVESRTRLVGDAARGAVLLQLRDRVLDSLARNRTSPRPLSVGLESGRQRLLDLVTTTADSVTTFLMPTARPSVVPTVIIGRRDTAYALPNGGRTGLYGMYYFLPASTDGRVCLILAREYDLEQITGLLADSGGSSRDRRSSLMRAVGPCAFYTSFGVPGPGIELWLRAQDYAIAGQAQWDRAPTPVAGPEPEDLTGISMSFWELLKGGSSGAFAMGPLSFEGRACAHGQLDFCRAALQSRFADLRPPLGKRYAVAHRWWFANDAAATFLSDLVRLEGRDRFDRFWRSPLPVERAFTDAFGLSIEQWTHRWLLGRIAEPRFGPVIRFSSVLVGLGLIAAAVLIAAFLSARRRVG